MTSGGGRKGGKLSEGIQDAPQMAGAPWSGQDRPRDLRSAMSKLFAYLGGFRRPIAVGVALTVLSSLLSVAGPQLLREISDSIYDGIVAGHIDHAAIGALAWTMVALYGLSATFGISENYIISATSERVANKLRKDLACKIDRLPLDYYDNSSTGDIMSRITNDADSVGSQCGTAFNFLFAALTTIFGCMAMMLYTDIWLGIATILPPAIGFISMRTIIRRTQRLFVAQSGNLGAMNGHIEESYYGHRIVKSYNGEGRSRARFVEINDDLYRTAYRSRFTTSAIPQIMGFISNLGYVLVCIIGSVMVIRGEITYGVVVAFIVYVRMFSMPLMMLSDALASMQSLAASSERVFELLEAPEMGAESDAFEELGAVEGRVTFDGVCFGYVDGVEVLRDFSLEIGSGERVAIVGPTGAGKTTVANLLMRFYEPDSGEIRMDERPLSTMRRGQVHSLFSVVLQDPWFFNGRIRDNLLLGDNGIADCRMEEACRAVGIHDFIESLPEGYDTLLTDEIGMSAGQKQQVAIARAMLRDAPITILDEATSSVDVRTEKMIQEALGRLTDGRTSFVIAHRLSTVRDCHRVIVMNRGRIEECGTHEELLSKNGFYAELYGSQFEDRA